MDYSNSYIHKSLSNIIKTNSDKTFDSSKRSLYQKRFNNLDDLDSYILNLESDFDSNKYFQNFLEYSEIESNLDVYDRSLRENTVGAIKLPRYTTPIKKDFFSLLDQRKSKRIFNMNKWTMKDISLFLKGINSTNERHAYASGGGLYPVSLYMIFNNVVGLDKKIVYKYQPVSNTLKSISKIDIFSINDFVSVDNFKNANLFNCFGVLVANRLINEQKYGDRGLFFSIIEAGEILQNFELVSTAYEYNFCQLGGFKRTELKKLLKIDDLYSLIVGTFIVGE